ncbi:symporter [Myxococcus sp. RHSTA-1-4]|uniref:symporter n=1 Tax=Myxococcus sp. RHSTA-1-4 TaxID=2874601 RepID=UPI001CC016D6|nr:symporter [Myxococcus sp. RHSTA-1-4]MBZ4415938.1 symporter [Myxococcus sp. RHSTA-1-4]
MREPLLRAVTFLASNLLVLMALALGLSMDWRRSLVEFRRPVFWRGVVLALLVVPAWTIAIVKVLPLHPVVAGALLLMAFSPGVLLLVRVVRGQRGNVPLAMALSLTLTLAALLLLPLALRGLNALFPLTFRVPSAALFTAILPGVLLPLALGSALRWWRPGLARWLRPGADLLAKVALIASALVLLGLGVPRLRAVDGWALLAVFLMVCGGAFIGHMAGGPALEDRRTLAIAGAVGNPAIAMFVASVSYPEMNLLPIMAAFVLLRTLALLPYKRWSRHLEIRTTPRPPGPLLRSGPRLPV